MTRRPPDDSGHRSTRMDWSRVTRAVAYIESALPCRFNGNGLVRGCTNPGWLRGRLRELLEAFPTRDEAQTWIRAACFKAKDKGQPMAYLAKVICEAARDAGLRDIRRLLSVEELAAFRRADRGGSQPDGSDQRGSA